LLSLGPQIQIGDVAFTLPYHVLFGLPPLNAMRHPFTFAAVAGFLLAVTAGIGWAGLACSRRRGVGVLIVSLAFLETLAPPVELRPVPTGLPPAYQLLQKLPPGAILDLPVFNPESMLWATRHDLPVVNGIGAFAPRYTLQLEQRINRHWIASAPDDLDRSKPMEFFISLFPLRYVIVPCGRAHGYGGLVAAFERSKQFVFVARADDGDRIYELRR
jgi:hypothetical protein